MRERFADRRVAVAREMTKLHEEVIRGTVAQVADLLAGRDVLGEVVVVLEGASTSDVVDPAVVTDALLEQLAGGTTTGDAVDFVAQSLGVARRDVYRRALELRSDEGR